ncbi:MAG: hypothetical protein V1859_09780 [archaeon]
MVGSLATRIQVILQSDLNIPHELLEITKKHNIIILPTAAQWIKQAYFALAFDRLEVYHDDKSFTGGDYGPQFFQRGIKDQPVFVYAFQGAHISTQEIFGRALILGKGARDNGASLVHLVMDGEPLYARADRLADMRTITLELAMNQIVDTFDTYTFANAHNLAATMAFTQKALENREVIRRYREGLQNVYESVALPIATPSATTGGILIPVPNSLGVNVDSFLCHINPIYAYAQDLAVRYSKLIETEGYAKDGSNLVVIKMDGGNAPYFSAACTILREEYGFVNLRTIELQKERLEPNDPAKVRHVIEKNSEGINPEKSLFVNFDDIGDSLGSVFDVIKEITKNIGCPQYYAFYLTHTYLSDNKKQRLINDLGVNIITTDTTDVRFRSGPWVPNRSILTLSPSYAIAMARIMDGKIPVGNVLDDFYAAQYVGNTYAIVDFKELVKTNAENICGYK